MLNGGGSFWRREMKLVRIFLQGSHAVSKSKTLIGVLCIAIVSAGFGFAQRQPDTFTSLLRPGRDVFLQIGDKGTAVSLIQPPQLLANATPTFRARVVRVGEDYVVFRLVGNVVLEIAIPNHAIGLMYTAN